MADQSDEHQGGDASESGQESQQQQQQQEPQQEKSITPTTPPPAPNPSTDPRLLTQARTPPPLHAAAPTDSSQDLFKISPIAALKLLGSGIEALVRMTGDIPPTPPPANPTFPHMSGMQREKAAIVRSYSEKSLARLREQAEAGDKQKAQELEQAAAQGGNLGDVRPPAESRPSTSSFSSSSTSSGAQQESIDGVRLRPASTPSSSGSTASGAPGPYVVIGANSQPLNLQHSAITRKFFSKAPPPISIEEYLLRIHRFCPMSTAVYLATSYYIFRLAVEERAIAVTRRNCHRLLLAGLRVAMKALEDLSYPHRKVARVGGVSEAELARLEISFCFLAGFELVVREETLRAHWETLSNGTGFLGAAGGLGGGGGGIGDIGGVPILKLENRRKKIKPEFELVIAEAGT
ncbi:hypothetical protein SLS62_008263 [Diatrype stigma]|uniref:Uncharacterized protein n=1 Tax=Diatrype stigma TaxID=117547 RepID=A0AAN9UTI4_9PEZI